MIAKDLLTFVGNRPKWARRQREKGPGVRVFHSLGKAWNGLLVANSHRGALKEMFGKEKESKQTIGFVEKF